MDHRDIDVLMAGIAPVIHEIVSDAFKSVLVRVEALESRQAEKGDPGPPGRDGKDGAPGLNGADGKNGLPGADGKDGVPGRDGKDGAPGRDGKDGAPGKDGVDGLVFSDLDEYIERCVQETVDDLPKLPIAWTVDDQGDLVAIFDGGQQKRVGAVRGKDGSRGASVMDGSVDEEGVLQLRMSDGRVIPAGVVRGRDGQAAEPVHGRPGRDAVEISILRNLDESRSYGAGVCAYWRGGVIRSERDTSPIVNGDAIAAGWSVMMNGIAEEYEETVDDGRTIVRTTAYTNGSESTRTIKTACVVDRGVWRDRTYEKGDGVTYSGSFFIAQRETAVHEKPGQSDAWRLAVKRGRDGQDGKVKDSTIRPVKA